MKRHLPHFESEAEMARAVVAWLTENQWDVYQEVNVGQCGGTCDIVAVRGVATWAIECKLALNLDVLGQAHRWLHRASLASVATPYKYLGTAVENAARQFLGTIGAGWLSVNPSPNASCSVRVEMDARFHRPRHDLRKHLHEAQKTLCAAGTNRGGYHTPFKATCRAVIETVLANPGITPKELLAKIKHHYANDASARGCIISWAEAGKMEGVKVVRVGKVIQFFPV